MSAVRCSKVRYCSFCSPCDPKYCTALTSICCFGCIIKPSFHRDVCSWRWDRRPSGLQSYTSWAVYMHRYCRGYEGHCSVFCATLSYRPFGFDCTYTGFGVIRYQHSVMQFTCSWCKFCMLMKRTTISMQLIWHEKIRTLWVVRVALLTYYESALMSTPDQL